MRSFYFSNFCVVFNILFFMGNLHAASSSVGEYILTVSVKSPAITPELVKINENVSVSFNVTLEKEKDEHKENVPQDVKSGTYTLVVGGEGMSIKSFLGGVIRQKDQTQVTKTTQGLSTGPTAVVIARLPGEKTVTLTVSLILKDGTEISASEQINFDIPDYRLHIYVKKSPASNGRYFVIADRGTRAKDMNVGHASWNLEVSQRKLANFETKYQQVANKNWGFGDSGELIDSLYVAARTLASSDNFTVSVPGKLSSDETGGEVGVIVIDSEDNVISVLQYTHSTKTSPPNYSIPSFNCVDACLQAINASGEETVNCKKNFKIKYLAPHRSGDKEWEIQLSYPPKLAEMFPK